MNSLFKTTSIHSNTVNIYGSLNFNCTLHLLKWSAACMTDIAKKLKNASQDVEAKIKIEEDHAEGKPSPETLNKGKVRLRDALT
jgi:hypothetical protein